MELLREKRGTRVLLTVIAVLTAALVGLLIWAAVLMKNQEEPAPTTQSSTSSSEQISSSTVTEPSDSQETKPTTSPTEPTTAPTEPTTVPTEPTTKPTEPKPTKPTEPKPSNPDTEEPKTPEYLAAEQKVAAFAAQHGFTLADYSEKLIDLLARKPETEEYVLNFPLEYGKDHPIDISGWADYEGVPLFIQWDKQWGYLDYTGNVAGLAACGPTCMSMIMYHFTRDAKYTPAYMMKFAESNKRWAVKGHGTQWAFFKEGGKELGLNVKELNSDQIASEKAIAKVLDSGRIIVMNVRPGVFTTIGHYLLVVGYEDGKFRVNDPNSEINSEKLWEFEEFSDQIKMMWSFAL